MRIEKRGKSSWRVQSMYKGRRYSVTFDHRPTQKEITIALAAKYEGGGERRQPGTVGDYAKKYIDGRRERGLSPATLLNYGSIIRNTPGWFLAMPLHDVREKDLQRLVDEYSATRSPKSASNMSGFYKSVLAESRPSLVCNVQLPRRVRKMAYNPTTEDVMRLVGAASKTRYGVFIQLAVLGLRRGEIAALTLDDLSDDDVLTISKDMIKGEDNRYTIKEVPKTSKSNRRILIPARLADEIRAQGYVYDGDIDTPNKYVHDELGRLGIPQFSLHSLRHFAAAYLNKRGFTRDQILEYCGWEKGSNVMERVYSYNLDPEEGQKDIAAAFGAVMP